MKDLMGKAIWDYYHKNNSEDLETETSISELDELPVAYLFREFDEMNSLEKKALELSKGKVLDIGAGAGSHSLYLQDQRELEVTALDISPKAIEICQVRGISKSSCESILTHKGETYDTLLLLMNGTGIFETLDKIDSYLQHLKSLMNPNGQILIDGTDILYMYEEEDGSYCIPADEYYGELDYILHYKGEQEDPIKWLYLDFDTLANAAENNGLDIELIVQDGDSYLAKLQRKI